MSGARELAGRVARAFEGRVRRQETFSGPNWPGSEFTVKGKHRGSPIEIGVFDGGCTFIARGWGRERPVFNLGLPTPNVEKRVTGIPGVKVPAYRHPATTAEELRELLGDPVIQRLCSGLALGPGELLGVTPRSVFLVHRSADVDALRRRLDLIAELIPQPKPARALIETAYRIKVGKPTGETSRGEARHTFGGALERPTTCRNCQASAHLLLTIDTTDPALALEALAPTPIRVVFCLDCMSFPSLTYVDQSGAHPTIVRQDAEERHGDTPPLDASSVTLSPMKAARGAGSKLGGLPKWIQEPQTPDCISCKKSMAFLAQLASTPTLGYADDGTLYTFVCETCRITASLIQSH